MMGLISMVCIIGLCLGGCTAELSSGYVNVNRQYGAHLFYALYPSKAGGDADPVVLWLQGGPGCSSMLGNYIENGPRIIQPDGTFKDNPYSWNSNATVIYIDSPVGTGYSYVEKADGYPSDEKTVSAELYTALIQILFNLHPQYGTRDFYIFGESYAGKYIPWLASTILENNKQAEMKILLKGVGIGDGWINPLIQTASMAPYLVANKRITQEIADMTNPMLDTFNQLVKAKQWIAANTVTNSLTTVLSQLGGINDVYDIRKESDPTIPLFAALEKYLNNPKTKAQFNVPEKISWSGCANAPSDALVTDEVRSSEFLIPRIVSQVPVLLYNGNDDFICNYMGTANFVSIMEWPHQNAFNDAKNTSFTVGGNPAGYYKTAYNLTLMVIYEAGHLVPFDQPENSQSLLHRFISNSL